MVMKLIRKIFPPKNERELRKIGPLVDEINALSGSYKYLSDEELKNKTGEFRRRLSQGENLDDILVESFATVREAAARVLNMRPFDVQLIGGIVLHRSKIAEMKTGEGKTLVATMPVYLNALTGKGVHVVTVNDYLARRDSEWMGELYKFLGLTVGVIQHDMDDASRQEAYRADVTYGTNNEFGFDYLRDNMKFRLQDFVQRGHYYAIVDEVDSILIDEARTPLIISGPTEESTDKYYNINRLTGRLKKEIDYQVDEKSRAATLTDSGVAKSENFLSVKNLYDPVHMDTLHHVNQALKAHTLFRRDVDYVVKDNQVVIVDEFTGRLMPGRRYSEGLHQALEAKEGVPIANENQTLASITFQNYFRLYDKLGGMTGTAETEAEEFMHIYGLDVVVIPTNRPLIRINHSDVIYKTANEKFRSVLGEIEELHQEGRPVLVGTISIENSEKLSRMLRRKKIKHHVLNAKYHEQEAQIISQAGQPGAVTISTNMAGRGTDIVLGKGVVKCPKDELGNILCCLDCEKDCSKCPKGNPEEYSGCLAHVPCGLHIIGTERHESRRIDNQLRGRSGRQGDPGSSRFYLSLEDDLLRIFGSERMASLMDRMNISEDEPIEHKWITSAIENAQKKVEANHFSARKHLLEYDDVMNKQREIIYGQRRRILEADEVSDVVQDMMEETLSEILNYCAPHSDHPEDWKIDELNSELENKFGLTDLNFDFLSEETRQQDLQDFIWDNIQSYYKKKEKALGEKFMRRFEKDVMLKVVDDLWKDHLLAMDHLREGIGLRGYGQKNPLIEYKKEGFDLFEETIVRIREDIGRYLMILQPRPVPVTIQRRRVPAAPSPARSTAANVHGASKNPGKSKKKIGRNDPCWCGSGKKYKKCHGR